MRPGRQQSRPLLGTPPLSTPLMLGAHRRHSATHPTLPLPLHPASLFLLPLPLLSVVTDGFLGDSREGESEMRKEKLEKEESIAPKQPIKPSHSASPSFLARTRRTAPQPNQAKSAPAVPL